MPCDRVRMPGGGVAIVCSRGPRKVRRCACGAVATRECDWKIGREIDGATLTCDKPLCAACSHVPAPDKDLCPAHAAEWKARLAMKEKV